MPVRYRGETFLTYEEVKDLIGIDEPDTLSHLYDARLFFYRGIVEPNEGFGETEGISSDVFAEGFFYYHANDLFDQFLLLMRTEEPGSITSITADFDGKVDRAIPAFAVIDGRSIKNDIRYVNLDEHWTVSIAGNIDGPVYFHKPVVDFVITSYSISPENPTSVEGEAAPTVVDEADIDPRERTSLLRIIKVLAVAQGLTLEAPHSAAEQLAALGARHGVTLPKKNATIAEKLRAARDIE